MKKFTKLASLALCLTLATVMFVACGGENKNPSGFNVRQYDQTTAHAYMTGAKTSYKTSTVTITAAKSDETNQFGIDVKKFLEKKGFEFTGTIVGANEDLTSKVTITRKIDNVADATYNGFIAGTLEGKGLELNANGTVKTNGALAYMIYTPMYNHVISEAVPAVGETAAIPANNYVGYNTEKTTVVEYTFTQKQGTGASEVTKTATLKVTIKITK